MSKIIVAVDGYSACGKSTTAKALARKLGYVYVDSGAMYRAVTLFFIDHQIDFKDIDQVKDALKRIELGFEVDPKTKASVVLLNDKVVEDRIRTLEVSNLVSPVSAIKEVRQMVVKEQQRMGRDRGLVMDGRDIGTVVFPDAELKLFMTADFKVRALRRQKELEVKGEEVKLEEVMENLHHRDELDTTRKESPLRKAEDAVVIDTTDLDFEEQVEIAYRLSIAEINK